ncbi:hypothetical protein BCT30_14520 [Enterovibrio norvegicus]|uniref:hypothetical protein n=1 Tax=Enterovibrio norvegicus TaxID=188144 RepID=UPI00030185BD|nr:hypothetical protein [Enterovibrio norvegicus]OEF48473.1 hypothetical protein A1OW_15165 [Enterovibrio norvegicus]PMH66021.1 hypothetical protein BCU62_10405 [Enterovibrio norvegicus]PMI30460.1 hypothetical protein BCU47_17490 [Enterovibrio norvegicus]PMI38669.1 hypothetical protein BCU46_01425 [Enterovibrio norvegicus]PMN51936.1 hypothetical protein BCT30_14520 [Enterovibrio norvegicus]
MDIIFLIATIVSFVNVVYAFITKRIFFAGGFIDYYENKSHFFAGLFAFILFIFFYGGFYFFIFPNVQ